MGLTRRYLLSSLLKFSDVALLVGSFLAAAVASLHSVGATSLAQFLSLRVSVRNFFLFASLLLIWHSLFSFVGLYESKRLSRKSTEALHVLAATSLATVVLFLVGSLFSLSVNQPSFLSLFWLVSTSTAVLSRRLLRFLLEQIRLRGRDLREVLIVGTNPRAITLADKLRAHPALGYRILGFVDQDWPGMKEFRKTDYAYVCDLNGFPSFLRESVVDEVVLALPIKSSYSEASRIATLCWEQGITTRFLSDLFDLKMTHARARSLDYESLVTIHVGTPEGQPMSLKRLLDVRETSFDLSHDLDKVIDIEAAASRTRHDGDAARAQAERLHDFPGNAHFFLRFGRQRNANRVANAFVQKDSETYRGFDRAGESRAGFRHAQMKWIVNFLGE